MSADRVSVLHVVGGLSLQGGTAAVVNRLSHLKLPKTTQQLWMHRDFSPVPTNDHVVRGGSAKLVNGLIGHDAFSGVREALALASWLGLQERVVLHAHTRVGMVAACLAGRWRRVPVVLHCHFLPTRPWIYHRLREFARAELLFNSPKTCRHFDATPEQALVLFPDVEWPEAPLPGMDGPVRFVAAGDFVPGKHLEVLVAAFRRLSANGGNATLALFGQSATPTDPGYQRTIENSCAGDPTITLHAWSPGWTRSLTASDILVHLGEPESFGLVILEAFVRGCRLVVLPQTFLDELPAPQRDDGVLRASSLDPEQVATALAQAASQPGRPNEFWTRRQAVKGLFCMEQHIPRLSSLYADMVRKMNNR